MSRRRKVERETFEFAAMMGRMIRAHGRRVANGDPEDLTDLIGLRDVLEAAIADAVTGQREQFERSWSEIARGLGTSRQAAQQRYASHRA